MRTDKTTLFITNGIVSAAIACSHLVRMAYLGISVIINNKRQFKALA